MKNVTVTLDTTQDQAGGPDAEKLTHYRFSITGSPGELTPVGPPPLSHTFQNVAPGTYTARVELSSADGSVVGPGMDSAPFEVQADIVLKVPAGLTVQVVQG